MSGKNKVDRNGLTEEEFLRSYRPGDYERPSLTVDMLIFTVLSSAPENYRRTADKTLQVLLIRRGEHPFLGSWAVPGGFVGIHESIDEAAKRELKSETGVDHAYLEQLYTWGEVGRDPRMRVVSCSYMALVDRSQLLLQAGEDADDARWFDVSSEILSEEITPLPDGERRERRIRIVLENEDVRLEPVVQVTEHREGHGRTLSREVEDSGGLAFDHAKMIQYGIERLRSKLEYTDIAFALMPQLFTLSELQRVYEVILGKPLLAAAFRRKIAGRVEETEEYTREGGHRPSKLYRYRQAGEELDREEERI